MSSTTDNLPLAARIRARLGDISAARRDRGEGFIGESPTGHLLRPLLVFAGNPLSDDQRLWSAAAALQYAHEASLLHDDVVDNAPLRRSRPTLAAAEGVAAALLQGDHLLVTAYRLAAETGSMRFVSHFARSVERTVAGEKLQGKATGKVLTWHEYRRIVGLKSGELFGCALAAEPLIAGMGSVARHYALGRRVGILYQMLDDLLDYLPSANSGKPPYADISQKRFTWPLLFIPHPGTLDRESVLAQLHTRGDDGRTPMQHAVERFMSELASLRMELQRVIPRCTPLTDMLAEWGNLAYHAVAASHLEGALARLPGTDDPDSFFEANSHSFSFAARLIPAPLRRSVTAVYAFCRVTDELADGGDDRSAAEKLAALDAWEVLARRAWNGEITGVRVVDIAMHDAAVNQVPFECISQLVEGMRMDMHSTRYATLSELRVYSHRVAGVVGEWLTHLCGIHDPAVLRRAAALGHALQLTNILRDVGEDLARGRMYLPEDLLRSKGITPATLREMQRTGTITAAYKDVIEELMSVADADYEYALPGIEQLPPAFGRAVAAAAHIYRGIHDQIRGNGHDNLRKRAFTSPWQKLTLTARSLTGLPLSGTQRDNRSGAEPPAELISGSSGTL